MISKPSLLPEELNKHELHQLAVIADKTPYHDLRKAAIALLMTSPLLFPKPIPAEAEEMEALSAAWGPVGREVTQLQTPPDVWTEEDIARADAEAKRLHGFFNSETAVPTVDDVRPVDDGGGFPAAPEPQTEKTVADAIVEEGSRLGIIDVPTASDLAAIAKRHADILESRAQMGEAPITPGKSKRKSPDWSAEETERLIAYVDATSPPRRWDEIVSEFPGRTVRALQNRADRLGLGKGNGAKSITEPVAEALAAKQLPSGPVTQDHVEDLRKALEEAFAEPVQVQKAAAVEPELVPDATPSSGAEILAQQVTQAKENLDEMFPPNRASAVRESSPSRVEHDIGEISDFGYARQVRESVERVPQKAKPAATFPPAWEPKETFKAPETIDDVMAWCRRQGDDVSQDGKMFTVNSRRLFPSEFIARANNLRVAAGGKPFEVAAE